MREAERVPWFSLLLSEASGAVCLVVALLATLALASHAPGDRLLEWTSVENAAGVIGANLSAALLGAFGLGATVLVAFCAVAGSWLVMARPLAEFPRGVVTGGSLLMLALTATPALLAGIAPARFSSLPAGWLGTHLALIERTLLSPWGGLLLNVVFVTAGLLRVTNVPAAEAVYAVLAGARATGHGALELARLLQRGTGHVREQLRTSIRAVGVWRERRSRRIRVAELREEIELDPISDAAGGSVAPVDAVAPAESSEDGDESVTRGAKRRTAEPAIVDHAADRKSASRAPRQEAFVFTESRTGKPYQMPEIELFEKPASGGRTYDRESLIMNSRILEKKLRDFGVLGRVVTVHPGPVITMYEFEPASGVKINRIVNLSDDLALALRALSIRIIAPIPGKSVVGIEVPNPEREIVSFRDLLESENFRNSRSRLTLALGKDIFGNPVEADLARMPHLLVAGATGTGKSVFLNSLLCSILFRATPDELKLLLVDPKLLELSIYEGIPHLIADVVTNPKRAAAALAGIVHKMEERYQMMAALGVRSIDQFNGRVDEELAAGKTTFRLKPKPGETEGREVPFQRLPYIVVVIDELADLMVVSARDVEEALQRLAQMARAAGIHLVLATQRPSVDVLTGVIKANFPARLSFQVSSRTDSRTILDQNGAETLLGQGDMLFLPPGTSKLQRIHGAYVSEKEVGRLVAFLREQGQPQFDEKLLELGDLSEVKEERADDVDEMYDRAIAIVTETRNASISYLQRRLKVGYNRAARMIEQMETDGVIGPQEGTKPREVYARAAAEL